MNPNPNLLNNFFLNFFGKLMSGEAKMALNAHPHRRSKHAGSNNKGSGESKTRRKMAAQSRRINWGK